MDNTPGINNKKIATKSDHIVIRKVITSFTIMLVLLLASNLTMSYVASRGFTSTDESLQAIQLIEPLRKVDGSITSITAIYKLIALSSIDDSLLLLDKLVAIKLEYVKNIADLEKTQKAEHVTSLNLEAIKSKYKDIETLGQEMALAFIEGDVVKGKELIKKVEASGAALEAVNKNILLNNYKAIKDSGEAVRDFFKLMRMLAFALMAASVIFAIIILISIVRGIRRALEIEQQTLKEKITDIVQRLSASTQILSAASLNLNDANDKLASSSEEQTQAASRVVAAVDEMTAIVQETLKQTQQSAEISEKTQKMTRSGREAVQKMSDSMSEIQAANLKLTEIVQLMSEITSKTNVINDIVFQTKLLSFNASVEAARAGEHGKGFAVVADEIGNLAVQSGQSAQAINHLLSDGNEKVNSVVKDIRERTGAAEQTSIECVNIFTNMEALNTKLNSAITQISSATNEVKIGIEHTATSIAEIDQAINFNTKITRDNQAQSTEVKQGSNELSTMVEMLKNIIE